MTADQQRALIALFSVTNFVIGMGAFLVVGMITPIANSLDISTAQAGQVMTVYALSYAVLSPFLVAVTGSVGRRRAMTAALILFALSNLVACLSETQAGLNLSRIIAAAGAGMFTPVAAATAAGLSSEADRGKTLAAVFFGLTLAQVLGVPTGSFVAYTFGWRTAFGIVLVLSVPCILLIWTRVPAGLRFLPVSLKDLGSTMQDLRLMLAILFTATFLGSIYVLYTYVAPLLEVTMGFSRNGITLALFVAGIGAVIGNGIGGAMADRLGPRRWLLIISLAQVGVMPFFSLLPKPELLVFVLILIWNALGWSFMASQQVRLISLAGPKAPVVLALNAAAIYIGAALGSALGGFVIAQFGLQTIGAAAGLAAILAVLHTIWSHKLNPEKPIP